MSITNKINTINNNILDGKQKIASAITNKGVDTPDTASFEVMAANISNIQTGDGGTGEPPFSPKPYVPHPDWPVIEPPETGVCKFLFKGNSKVSFIIETKVGFGNKYTVDWGDGTVENLSGHRLLEHTYDDNGKPCSDGYTTYVCTITRLEGSGIANISFDGVRVDSSNTIIGGTSTVGSDKLLMAYINNYMHGYYTFQGCTALEYVHVAGLEAATHSTAIGTQSMFDGCVNLKAVDFTKQFNFQYGRYMFNRCYSLEYVNLENFMVPKYTTPVTVTLEYMFQGCSNLRKIDNMNNIARYATNIFSAFKGCINLEGIEEYEFNDNEKLTSCAYAFQDCKKLKRLENTKFMRKCPTYNYLFDGCENLEYVNMDYLNNTSSFTATYMFRNCKKLNSIDTALLANASDLSYAFQGCLSLEEADLSYVTAKKFTNMFNGCTNLKFVKLPQVLNGLSNSSDVIYAENMFTNCPKVTFDKDVKVICNSSFYGTNFASAPVDYRIDANGGFANGSSDYFGIDFNSPKSNVYIEFKSMGRYVFSGSTFNKLTFVQKSTTTSKPSNYSWFYNCDIKQMNITLPNDTSISSTTKYLSDETLKANLEGLSLNMSKATTIDLSGYAKLSELKITTPVLNTLNIQNNNLDAEALNKLFDYLPSTGGTVTITGNPGVADCNDTIATYKGWNVVK